LWPFKAVFSLGIARSCFGPDLMTVVDCPIPLHYFGQKLPVSITEA